MEVPDGAVRVMIGGQNYTANPLNRVVHAFRQPGSSFSTYVFLMALEGGATPDMMVDDSTPPCGGWVPQNYHANYHGSVTLTHALATSLNTVPVQLSLNKKYGERDQLLKVIEKLGVSEIMNATMECNAIEKILLPYKCTVKRLYRLKKTCSMALGDQGITPLAHTAGYAHLANGGQSMKPYAIVELRNKEGAILYDYKRDAPPPKQLFDPKAVAMLNGMLEKVVSEGTGKAAALDFTTAAGKTGTSSNYRDAWFIGFAGQLVTGVWMGNDDFSPMNQVTGGKFPAEIWANFYKSVHAAGHVEFLP
jgi:penicillin-binding protein 1A